MHRASCLYRVASLDKGSRSTSSHKVAYRKALSPAIARIENLTTHLEPQCLGRQERMSPEDEQERRQGRDPQAS